MKTPLLLLLVSNLLCLSFLNAQELRSIVKDGKTNQPLESASVYFDNTTIGTTTNSSGEFIIDINPEIHTPLIISFLGYETLSISEYENDAILEIFLFENEDVLDEVVIIADDGWSRSLKLREFRKHYLGESYNGKSCKILNEDDLVLRYDKRRKKLTATSKAPLLIKNRNLQYKITVNLNSFEVNYAYVSKNKKRLNVNYVYYAGGNFYESIQENPTKKTIQSRKSVYDGSVLHFMRSVARENLKKQGFRVYLGNSEIHPGRVIKIRKLEDTNGVFVFLKDRLNVVFKDGRQSSVESFVDEFYIDSFGNHSPADQVRFGGDLGKQRMGDTLPLDFLSLGKKSISR